MKKAFFLIVLTLFSIIKLFCAEDCANQNSSFHVLAVAGQHGLGSKSAYVVKHLHVSSDSVIQSPTPRMWPFVDLGQNVCMHKFGAIVPKGEDFVIHATSQGTATVLNYVATMPPDQQSRVKAIVLEAALASGNSAIMQTVTGPIMGLGFVDYLPGSYYYVPYIAKTYLPCYWPTGKQPIKSIENISNDIPIIIIHSKDDQQLLHEGACALYYRLRAQGNKNAYLISCDKKKHVHILSEDGAPVEDFLAILAHHNIIQQNSALQPLDDAVREKVQPAMWKYQRAYEEISAKERNHTYFAWALRAAALYGAYRLGKGHAIKLCTDAALMLGGLSLIG